MCSWNNSYPLPGVSLAIGSLHPWLPSVALPGLDTGRVATGSSRGAAFDGSQGWSESATRVERERNPWEKVPSLSLTSLTHNQPPPNDRHGSPQF